MSYARRLFAPDLAAYVEDYGPDRRACLYVGDLRPFAEHGPLAVCLHPEPQTARRGGALLAALDEVTVRELHARGLERRERSRAAWSAWERGVMRREAVALPVAEPLPTWPEAA